MDTAFDTALASITGPTPDNGGGASSAQPTQGKSFDELLAGITGGAPAKTAMPDIPKPHTLDDLNNLADQINTLASKLDKSSKTLDKTDQNAIDAYNTQIDQYKALQDTYKEGRQRALNADIAQKNKEADYNNSFSGMFQNTMDSIGGKLGAIEMTPYNIVKGVVAPDKQQLDWESKNNFTSDNPVMKVVDAIANPIADFGMRAIKPFTEAITKEIGGAISKSIFEDVKGTMSATDQARVLNNLKPYLDETVVQHLGNLAQGALLFSGIPEELFAGSGISAGVADSLGTTFAKNFASRIPQHMANGALFGVAQAMSNGSSDPSKIADTIGSTMTGMALLGGLVDSAMPTASKAFQMATKNVIQKYGLPSEVRLEPEQIKDIFQTQKLTTAEQRDLYTKLGRTADQMKSDFKSGVTIKIPSERMIEITDKSYWVKIKSTFNMEPTNIKIDTSAPTASFIRGYLPERAGGIDAKAKLDEITSQFQTKPNTDAMTKLNDIHGEMGLEPAFKTIPETQDVNVARHGDNILDEADISAGHQQPGLTEGGKEQVQTGVAKDWKDKGIKYIVTSDAPRSVQSAEIVAKEIGAKVIQDPRLRTQNLGNLAGNKDSVVKPVIESMANKYPDEKLPAGESHIDLVTRVESVYKDTMAKYPPDQVGFILHGDVEKTMRSGFGRNMAEYNREAIGHGKSETVAIEKKLPPREKQIAKKKKVTTSIEQAKEHKSIDDFMKAQGAVLYHGTSATFKAFDSSMKGTITGAESAKGAIWFTDNPKVAKAYAVYASEEGVINKLNDEIAVAEKVAKKSGLESDWAKYDALVVKQEDLASYEKTFARRSQANVKEAVVTGSFYTVDAKGKTPQELSADGNIDSWLNQQLSKARELGKDGVIFKNLDDAVGLYDVPSTHYAIFDSKNIQTKEQLIEIYNKAHGDVALDIRKLPITDEQKNALQATREGDTSQKTADIVKTIPKEVFDNAPKFKIQEQKGPHGTIHEGLSFDEAVETLLKEKGGEAPAVVTNPELGSIDLIYGEPGKEGYGLAKIASVHPDVLPHLQELLETGKVVGGIEGRKYLETESGRAVVRLDWEANEKRWVLTAFFKNPVLDEVSRASRTTGVTEAKANTPLGFSISNATPESQALISREEAVAKLDVYKARLNLTFDTRLVDTILTGIFKDGIAQKAYGVMFDNTIGLAEKVTEFTADHEVGHLIFKNLENIPLFDGITREGLLTEAGKKFGDLTPAQLEEKIMEGFEDYARDKEAGKTNKAWTDQVADFFKRLWQGLKEMLGLSPFTTDEISAFYERTYEGVGKENVNLESTGAFPEGNIVDFGKVKDVVRFNNEAEQDAFGSEITPEERDHSFEQEQLKAVEDITNKYESFPSTLEEANKLTPEELANVFHFLPSDVQYQIAGIDPQEASREMGGAKREAIDSVLNGKLKLKADSAQITETRNALGRGLFMYIFRKNATMPIDEFATTYGVGDDANDVALAIRERYEERLMYRAKAKETATRMRAEKKSAAEIRKGIEATVREAMAGVATQKTTTGAETRRVILETVNPQTVVQMKEGTVLKIKLKAMAEGAKTGSKVRANDIKSAQNVLVQMMTKGLPITERGKSDMLVAIKNANTPDKLDVALEKISAKIEAYNEARAMAKDLGLARSKIAFIKKIGELDSFAVMDARKQLGIEGPIADMSQSDLDRLAYELVQRLQFKRSLGFGIEDQPLTEEDYQTIAEKMAEDGRVKGKPVLKRMGTSIDKAIGISSTRLYNIAPTLGKAVRDMAFNNERDISNRKEVAKPFVDFATKLQKKNPVDYEILDLALKNRDAGQVNAILAKYPEADIAPIRALMGSIEADARTTNIEMGHLDNYFPRQTLPGMEHPLIETKMRQAELRLGRRLTTEEADAIANNIMLGFDRTNYMLTKTGSMKERQVDVIDGELAKYYAPLEVGLNMYIETMTRNINARKFFGKYAEGMAPNDDYEDSIGTYLMDLVGKGEFTPDQEKEVGQILKGIFTPSNMSEFWRALNTTSYATMMGDFNSMLSILNHYTYSLWRNGVFGTMKATTQTLLGKAIGKDDIYIDESTKELIVTNKIAHAVSNLLKYAGVRLADSFTLKVYMQGRLNEYQKLARSGKLPYEFRTKLEDVFGKDYKNVLNDLKEGIFSEAVKRLIFDDVLDVRPEGSTEKAEYYNISRNGKLLYTLKQFLLKQFDVYRKYAFDEIKDGIHEGDSEKTKSGLKNLVKLITAFMLVGMTVDEIKNILYGKPFVLRDEVANVIAKLGGLSSYTISTYTKSGLEAAVIQQFMPVAVDAPFKLASDVTSDVTAATKGQLTPQTSKSIQHIPLVGRLIYNRLHGSNLGTVETKLTTLVKTADTKVGKFDPTVVAKVSDVYAQVKKAGIGTPEADALVAPLTDSEYTVYKAVKAADIAQQVLDSAPKVLPIVEQAHELGFGTPEADKLIEPLSDAEYSAYQKIKTELYGADGKGMPASDATAPTFDAGSVHNDKSIIGTVVAYAKALGTDPVTAFERIFTGQRILRTENGAIIVERNDKAESTQKKALGGTKAMTLDHLQSFELGGDNSANNMWLIPKDQAAIDDKVENYLGKALSEGKINGKQALEYETRYKKGADAKYIDSRVQKTFDKVGEPLTFDQIKQEVGI